jgi:SAM-dependent methyltransferase
MTAKPRCRSCGAPLHHSVLDLGRQPLANAYLYPDEIAGERIYPLHARYCGTCHLVQVDDAVTAADLFEDYPYFSSFSDSWVRHARTFVDGAVTRFALGPTSFVVEIASNDGYLLTNFVERGIPVLGVEPAKNVADAAVERGVPTEVRFFGMDTAGEIVAAHRRADLIVANNVLAHVPDLNDFVSGLATLLDERGVISIEVPHLLRLVQEVQFDTIYHEHFSYFSLLAATAVLERHGLRVIDVEQWPTHGGSLRMLVMHASPATAALVQPSVAAVGHDERAARLDAPEGFVGFARRAERVRADLVAFLAHAAGSGERVVAYGAAAKGNTLLNYAGVGTGDIDYVVDRSPHKQGRLLPGSHLPIRSPGSIDADRPEIVLILPWNLRDEIMGQMRRIEEWGGRFVVAVPRLEVLSC